MEDNDGWEEVMRAEPSAQERVTRNARRFILINKILWILNRVRRVPAACDIKCVHGQKNNFNKYGVIRNYVARQKLDDTDGNIAIFKYCVRYNVPVRIGFVLGKHIKTFLELCLTSIVESHKKKYKDEVIGLDYHLNVTDLTFLYSHKLLQVHLNETLKRHFKGCMSCVPESDVQSVFVREDKAKMAKIPSSLSKMKNHPVYIVESLLDQKKFVFSKRLVYGYFKGEPVYDKDNVQQLRTERQWYYRGKKVKSEKPYRIVSDEKLYAEWQTEDIVVPCLQDRRYMDYFHANFLPAGCLYTSSPFAEEVAKLLGIRYKGCVTRFANRMPVVEGAFIEKQNAYLYFNALREHTFYATLRESNHRGLCALSFWRKLIRRVGRYLDIKRQIG